MKNSDIRKALILNGFIMPHHTTKTPEQVRKEKQSAINARRRDLGFPPIHVI